MTEEREETDTCPVCDEIDDRPLIGCDGCNEWFHMDCVNLNSSLADEIKNYYCDTCELVFDVKTVWKREQASQEKERTKLKYYYEVEKICSHEIIEEQGIESRFFEIKWKGCEEDENTLEPEENLDCSIDLLQDYLREHALPFSTVKGIVGASKTLEINEENWISIQRVHSTFLEFKNRFFPQVELEAQIWNLNFEGKDGIYFLKHYSHCFVILYFHRRKLGYIADGENMFTSESAVSKSLRTLLQINLKGCEFKQQTAVDHCGSSAVLIGLEMVRCYLHKIRPNQIVCPCKWRKNLVNRFHRFKSVKMKTSGFNHLSRNHCPKCGKVFRLKQRRSLLQHIAKCNFSK